MWRRYSSNEDNGAAGSLDALLGDLGEFLGLDDGGDVGELSLSEHLEEALCKVRLLLLFKTTYGLGNINHCCLRSGGSLAGLFGDESPELVQVDGGSVVLVSLQVEVTLALLSKVSWMARNGAG